MVRFKLTNLNVHDKGELLYCYKMGNIEFVSQLLTLIVRQLVQTLSN